MSFHLFDSLSAWAMLVSLGVHFAIGGALGFFYFRAVWWSARLFAKGAGVALIVALIVGRFAVLAGLLTLASFEGAPPLLAMALGVLVARSAILRRPQAMAR